MLLVQQKPKSLESVADALIRIRLSDFKYDVAFSFLADDEGLATELNDLLSGRLSTFLYSRRQEELAGTDGEKSFNDVFGRDARLVVILHREGWGESPWTRIEQTAIRNRAYDEGYEFCVFVPVVLPAKLPSWVPKTEIWVGLDRWGTAGAASVIEARVQKAGGSARKESAVDQAARIERQRQAEHDRQIFLGSQFGVDAAHADLDRLFGELDALVPRVNTASPSTGLEGTRGRDRRSYLLRGSGLSVTIAWSQQYSNSLKYSSLYVRYWGGAKSFDGRVASREPEPLRELNYDFDRPREGLTGWREEHDASQRVWTSVELADDIVHGLLDLARGARR